jgi:hypothetical protein
MLPPPVLTAPGFKSRLLRPSGGFGLEGMEGMWECKGGVPQQLLPPAPLLKPCECAPGPPGLRGGGRPPPPVPVPAVGGPAAKARCTKAVMREGGNTTSKCRCN